jgi:NADH-quinone oxidoreductase subunit J
VLLLFGVMLTHKIYDLDLRSEVTQPLAGWLIAMLIFVFLTAVAVQTEWAAGAPRSPAPTTRTIGEMFMGPFLLPFEAASILLLVALMGAAMIVRRKKDA